MSPDTLAKKLIQQTPLLKDDQHVGDAIRTIVEAQLPALPVVDGEGRLFGIFGEREFIAALFPGYLGELRSAAFVPESVGEAIEMRLECRQEPAGKYANTEKIAVGQGHSDAQLAETFLHHRVLIVPVVDEDQRVAGIVTRSGFFQALARRLLER
jgi:CBS domain-containing protein